MLVYETLLHLRMQFDNVVWPRQSIGDYCVDNDDRCSLNSYIQRLTPFFELSSGALSGKYCTKRDCKVCSELGWLNATI